MGFSRQEHWSGLLCPSLGDLPWPRDEICVSSVSYIGRQVLQHWATWEACECVQQPGALAETSGEQYQPQGHSGPVMVSHRPHLKQKSSRGSVQCLEGEAWSVRPALRQSRNISRYDGVKSMENQVIEKLRAWIIMNIRKKVLVGQSYLTLCDSVDYSPSGSSVHGILQARILEWVAIPFSRGSSRPRDRTRVSCIAGGFFTVWATRATLERTLGKSSGFLFNSSSNFIFLSSFRRTGNPVLKN